MKAALLLFLLAPLLYAATPEVVVYKKTDYKELHLTIIKPVDWKATDSRPAMVWFHGGGKNAPTSN